MSAISAQLVKELRERTNVGMMECKKALVETEGDLDKASVLLRERGIAIAAKKSSREAKEGTVASYVHMGGKVGVLVEINCETDFAAKNEVFQELAKDLTLHIAAASPRYVRREEVPQEVIDAEKEIFRKQAEDKPAQIVDKIVDGKLNKFFSDICLLEQGFVKDPDQTVQDLVTARIAEIGENILIRRFTRYALGE